MGNGLPYYKKYPRDFIEGTIGLGFELKAAYSLILDLIYLHAGDLPDDKRYISGVLGCHPRRWFNLRKGLIEAGKIELVDGYLRNRRASNELLMSHQFQQTQRLNATSRNKNKDLPKAMAEPSLNHTDTDTDRRKKDVPKGTSKKEAAIAALSPTPRFELMKVLDGERTSAVIEHRQRIRSPLTARAAKMLAKKFALCPDPNYAADEMVVNGWRGFEPSWLESRKENGNGNGRQPTLADFTERLDADIAAEEAAIRSGGSILDGWTNSEESG